MFEMDEKAVYSIVSKMMIAEELHGSWDQPTRTIVMHSIEASKVQSLAAQFADKATVSVLGAASGASGWAQTCAVCAAVGETYV
jgi:hypothetical protein